MNTALKALAWVMLWPVTAGGVVAQESAPAAVKTPSKSTAQMEAGEPRADTSMSTGGAAAAPKSSHRPRAPAAARSPGAAGQKAPRAADRVDLDTATVTGDREQPKVMYIVPWKKADIGDPSGKPINSLLDEALAPVDRDEFKREVAYYDAVKAGTPQSGAPKSAAK